MKLKLHQILTHTIKSTYNVALRCVYVSSWPMIAIFMSLPMTNKHKRPVKYNNASNTLRPSPEEWMILTDVQIYMSMVYLYACYCPYYRAGCRDIHNAVQQFVNLVSTMLLVLKALPPPEPPPLPVDAHDTKDKSSELDRQGKTKEPSKNKVNNTSPRVSHAKGMNASIEAHPDPNTLDANNARDTTVSTGNLTDTATTKKMVTADAMATSNLTIHQPTYALQEMTSCEVQTQYHLTLMQCWYS